MEPGVHLTSLAVMSLMQQLLVDAGVAGFPVEAVQGTYSFSLDALNDNRHLVEHLLGQLPVEFMDDNEKAGHWSFLNAVEDSKGNRWANNHLFVEALVAAGLALGLVEWTRPREEWPDLPGGFPWMTILRSKFGGAYNG